MTEEMFLKNENLEIKSLASSLLFFIRHSIRDVSRRKFHYGVAFASVFVVVLSVLVINTIVEKGPVIFLRLAEHHHGEIDGYVTPKGSDMHLARPNPFLNYSRVVAAYGETRYNI